MKKAIVCFILLCQLLIPSTYALDLESGDYLKRVPSRLSSTDEYTSDTDPTETSALSDSSRSHLETLIPIPPPQVGPRLTSLRGEIELFSVESDLSSYALGTQSEEDRASSSLSSYALETQSEEDRVPYTYVRSCLDRCTDEHGGKIIFGCASIMYAALLAVCFTLSPR